MPTFHDPVADAAEARQGLRALAHASRSFDDPAHTYEVIGDLLSAVRSLRHVFDQLASAHLLHQRRASTDAGDPVAGTTYAQSAAEQLREAARLLDHAHARLDLASQHSGRIAWQPSSRDAQASISDRLASRLGPASPIQVADHTAQRTGQRAGQRAGQGREVSR